MSMPTENEGASFLHTRIVHSLLQRLPEGGTGDEMTDVEEHQSVGVAQAGLDGATQAVGVRLVLVGQDAAVERMADIFCR